MRVPTIPWWVWLGGPCIIYFWYIEYIQSIRFTVTDTTSSSNKLDLYKERERGRETERRTELYQKKTNSTIVAFLVPNGRLLGIHIHLHIFSHRRLPKRRSPPILICRIGNGSFEYRVQVLDVTGTTGTRCVTDSGEWNSRGSVMLDVYIYIYITKVWIIQYKR